MIISGIRKVTLLDFPGKVACSIFLFGCNMRCVFCHNKDIVEGKASETFSYEEVMSFLSERRSKIEAVCITGGEPTLNEELFDFIKDIKALGFLVKLDTNGTNPNMIKKLLDNNMLDYIAMDVKSSFKKYSLITNSNVDISKIERSITLIKNSGIDHEFRTTVINKHDIEDIEFVSKMVAPSKYYLQEFKYSDNIINSNVLGCSFSDLEILKDVAQKYTETYIRKK